MCSTPRTLHLAPFAEENDCLYISGAADTTGINDNTLRAGRQNYQDVATAATLLDDVIGEVMVFAQDTEFGKGNAKAVEAVRLWGAALGGLVYGLLSLRLPALSTSGVLDGLPGPSGSC